jgi:hypothetical protein
VITVTLRYPNGQLQEVVLEGVPAVGDDVRPNDGPKNAPPLRVIHRLWVEFDQRTDKDAQVLLMVEPYPPESRPSV